MRVLSHGAMPHPALRATFSRREKDSLATLFANSAGLLSIRLLQSDHAICAPAVSTYTEYNDSLAVMNNRLRLAPPKQMLAQVSGRRIMPMRSPLGAITWTPGRAPAQMLPSTSQRMPSAAEGWPVPGMSI